MIERAEHSDGFTVINNDVLRDMELSDGARALFVYMLTMSDDWNFSVEGLAYLTQRSPRKIAKLVTELKRRGYIEQKTRTDEHGRFLPAEWVIHEEPITALHENRRAVKPQRGQTAERTDRRAVAPQSGKRVVIRNNNSKEITNIKEITNGKEITKEKKEARVFIKPTVDDVKAYCQERQNNIDPQQFIDHYESNGWKVGRNSMKDWKAAVRTWEKNNYGRPRTAPRPIEEEENVWDRIIREEGWT